MQKSLEEAVSYETITESDSDPGIGFSPEAKGPVRTSEAFEHGGLSASLTERIVCEILDFCSFIAHRFF